MSVNITGSIFWPGSASLTEVTSSTFFNFYDEDAEFISESVASTNWAGYRLGFPSVDVELANSQFIAFFEEAVTEYGAQINTHLINEYMLTLQGSPTSSDMTGRQIRGGLGGIIRLSDTYGAEVGAGGDITWNSGTIPITASVQVYDLDALFASSMSRDIRIKKIFHGRVPASIRYFDPWGIPTSPGSYNLGFYGFGANEGGTVGGAGTSYVLRPVYEDLLRMQSIELNDQIRKSGYSFEIINNNIRLFPIPTRDFTLFFQYVFKDEADRGYISGSGDAGDPSGLGTITDPSNVPYSNIVYSYINSVGKQWIKKYFLATCKVTLGGIRGKFPNIPIPNSEVSLDGESLRSEGINERKELIEELKDMLEKSGKLAQMESKKTTDINMNAILSKIPLPIYIG